MPFMLAAGEATFFEEAKGNVPEMLTPMAARNLIQ